MFRATMLPSSGELTVPMRHWYFSLCMGGCLVLLVGIRLQSYPNQQTRQPPIFFVALRPNAGHGLLMLEVSTSHTTTRHSR